MASIGVPVKILHEAQGQTISIELKTGELFRGHLIHCEDNMNCQLSNIHYTSRDGRVSELEHAFIRGSKIRFFILPDMLKNAPMFKTMDPKVVKGKGLGIGRGRAKIKKGKNFPRFSTKRTFVAAANSRQGASKPKPVVPMRK